MKMMIQPYDTTAVATLPGDRAELLILSAIAAVAAVVWLVWLAGKDSQL